MAEKADEDSQRPAVTVASVTAGVADLNTEWEKELSSCVACNLRPSNLDLIPIVFVLEIHLE